jgi:hypothetical protein
LSETGRVGAGADGLPRVRESQINPDSPAGALHDAVATLENRS